MNYKITLIFLGVLLVGTVVGADLILSNKQITLDKALRDEAIRLNLTDIPHWDYPDGDLEQRCYKKQKCWEEIESRFDDMTGRAEEITITKCGNVIRKLCTNFVNVSELDKTGEDLIERYLNVSIIRNNAGSITPTREGTTTIR